MDDLTDLVAAEISRHRLRYGSEDAYNGERWLCMTCPWLVEADTGSRPNATVIQAHANHVAERLKLVVEQHTNGRIAELETELEKYKSGGRTLGKMIDRTLKDVVAAVGAEDMIDEDGDGDYALIFEQLAELRPARDVAIARAEKAEATIARVEALKGDLFLRGGNLIAQWGAARLIGAALEGEQQ